MTCLSNGENTTKVTKGLVAYIEALEPGEVYLMMVYAIHEELTSIPSKPVRVETCKFVATRTCQVYYY